MQGVIERVATEPTQGDTAILTTGKVRYTIKDASGLVLAADREETFRGHGDQPGGSRVELVTFSRQIWRDLVSYSASTVQTGQDPPKPTVQAATPAPPQKKGFFGGLFGS
jgi:hypothetical protein